MSHALGLDLREEKRSVRGLAIHRDASEFRFDATELQALEGELASRCRAVRRSLVELARVAGFSVSHFKPLFRRAVGVPVHRYVVEQRVERARRLILQGGRSMADIALESGFAHQSHMARWVRRVLGITPAQVAVFRY